MASIWSWLEDDGIKKRDFDADVDHTIETAFQQNLPTLNLKIGFIRYLINFATMSQTNEATGKSRTISRRGGNQIIRTNYGHNTITCDCPKAPCVLCSVPVKSCSEEDHATICPEKLQTCPAGCPYQAPRAQIRAHLATCPSFFVTCQYKGCQTNLHLHRSFGAVEPLRRSDLVLHLKGCTANEAHIFSPIKHTSLVQDHSFQFSRIPPEIVQHILFFTGSVQTNSSTSPFLNHPIRLLLSIGFLINNKIGLRRCSNEIH